MKHTHTHTHTRLVLCTVFAFQFTLCLAVKCTGVSIVWCAILAWLVMMTLGINKQGISWNADSVDEQHQSSTGETTALRPEEVMNNNNPSLDHTNTSSASINVALLNHHQQQQHAKLVIGLNTIVLLFYAIKTEIITTIAHVCAIALGLVLWKIACCPMRWTEKGYLSRVC